MIFVFVAVSEPDALIDVCLWWWRVPQQKLVSNIFLGGKWCFGTIEINLECKRTTGGGTWSDPGKYVLSGLWCCTVFVNAKKVQQRDGPREIITRIES